MADILIRGMEKPGSCRECDFCEVQDINFEILYFCNRNDRFLDDEDACNIPNDCPIIELPEHGDLISSENVIETIERLRDKSGNDEMAFALNWALRLIREKPVIVPSNKEGSE